MNEKTIDAIKNHYEHAKKKHPFFCGTIIAPETEVFAAEELEIAKRILAADAATAQTNAENILDCEIKEIWEAVAAEQTACAVYECYDAIAVLLRIIDELEGMGRVDAQEVSK